MSTERDVEGLVEAQLELEELGYHEGVRRYRRIIRGAQEAGRESEVDGGKHMVVRHLADVAEALEIVCKGTTGDGWPVKMKNLIRVAKYDVAALIILQMVIDGISQRRKPVALGAEIIDRLVTEVRVRGWSYTREGLWKYWTRRFAEKGTCHYGHRKKTMDAIMRSKPLEYPDEETLRGMKEEQVMVLDWLNEIDRQFTFDRAIHIRMGLRLINVVAEVTDMIERVPEKYYTMFNSPKVNMYVQPKEEYKEAVERMRLEMEDEAPILYPTLIPPRPWGKGMVGGYHGAMKAMVPLVRAHRADPDYYDEAEMPEVYDALNAVQDTPWKVNVEVLDVLNALRAGGGGTAGLPEFEPPFIRPVPSESAYTDEDEFGAALAVWKAEKTELLDMEMQRTGKVREVDATLRVARRLVGETRFWYPHNLDWRGRMYPVPHFLQPQGSDFERGLLTFHSGKPLGSDGAWWLAIHGANCMGKITVGDAVRALDKDTLRQRERWVRSPDVEQRIRESAQDPLGSNFWRDAEKPFQFLAFCFEWDRYLTEGEGYACSLPVHIDGSCNGIQHFSAMFRDETGGKAVNLTATPDHPTDPKDYMKPEDLYTAVAETVERILVEEETNAPDCLAKLWLNHGIDRKLAKRPTMTFGYGAKAYGMSTQILDHLGTKAHPSFKLEDDQLADTKARTIKACRFMAQTLWQALSETVEKAYYAMEWMQQSVRMVLKDSGECFEWAAPDGFPVKQRYLKLTKVKVTTMLAGSLYQAMIYKEDGKSKPAPVEQVNGVAPNFVHSLDACAMVRTINAAWEAGIENFAMVHDSYGTVPADVETLGDITRQEFIRLYTESNPVQDFIDACNAQYGGEEPLPEAPSMGTLDLNEILESLYFFS